MTYLLTGWAGLLPDPVQAELGRWLAGYYSAPTTPAALQQRTELLQNLRTRLAGLLKAPSGSVALTESVTAGFETLALGLDWRSGDEVVVANTEHLAGLAPWRRLQAVAGVRVVVVEAGPATGWRVLPERVAAALTERTRLICLSHVSYSTGARLDAAAVGRLARDRGIIFAVDGAQSVGAVAVDVGAIGCDAYSFCGYKWTLAPDGAAGLYLSPRLLATLRPQRFNYAAQFQPDGTYELPADARRFEGTGVALPSLAALSLSLDYLDGLGMDAVYERVAALTLAARQALAAVPGVSILTPPEAAGLLTFTVAGRDPVQVAGRLWAEQRILVRAVPNPPAVRASLHFYNDTSDIERLAAGLGALGG